MSLGGYKFAGRFCQKGSLTDQQWALLMHKTKVAAFMAANTLSGAGWDYDMAGSPDGNYHCLDSVGNNYVTVFKRMNGENDYTWFAIYTMTYATKTGTQTGTAKRSLFGGKFISGDSRVFYVGVFASAFFRIGNSQISYNDSLLDLTITNNGSTPLMPMANSATAVESYGVYQDAGAYGNDLTLFVKSMNYYGFALKDSDIIMFSGFDASGSFDPSSVCCSIASGNAFSTFIYNNDSKGVFAANLQSAGSGGAWDEQSIRPTSSTTAFPITACQYDNGNTAIPAYLDCVELSSWSGMVDVYPFQAISAFTDISGKGTIKINFLAVNMPKTSTLVNPTYSSAANGNYLTAISSSSTVAAKSINGAINPAGSGGEACYRVIYVGWDPSNPDITQASSWTEYTDA